MHVAGSSTINTQVLNSVMNAKNENELRAILSQLNGNKGNLKLIYDNI